MTTPSIPPPTHTYNMSQREAELGYPSGVNHGNRQLSFSLPSLPEMDLPRPAQSNGLPSKLDQLRVSKSSSSTPISPSPSLSITEIEIDDESSLPLKPRGGCTTPSPLSSTLPLSPASSSPSRSRAPSPSPSSSHSSSPTPTPGQSKPFSTWVPDDSLRFINPNFLSSAEKQTLEQQRNAGGSGKRKASTAESMSGIELRGDAIQSSGHVNKEEEEEVNRPKKLGRPLGRDDSTIPTLTPSLANLPYMFPLRERPSTFPSSLINRSSSRPPVPTSSNKPQLHRSQTDDLDLLRQVKSNNLSIPSIGTGIGTSSSSNIPLYTTTSEQLGVQPHLYRHQHRHQQHAQHPVQQKLHHQSIRQQSVPYQALTSSAQATYPHTATRQHHQQKRHQHYEPPFTHAPLYHPPSSSNYTNRPSASEGTKKRPVQSSPNPHPDRNLAPPPSTHSPYSSSDNTSSSVTTPDPTQKVSAATPLPPDDWRWGYVRRYGGRGRGQSGG